MAVREKRDQKKGKKDFVAQHTQVVKNWQEVVTMQMLNRKLQEEVKGSNARYHKSETLETKRAKALKHLVRWDDFRLQKAEMTELFFQIRHQMARKRVWVFMASFYCQISELYRDFRIKVALDKLAKAQDLSATRIKGRMKWVIMMRNAQL